MLGESAGTRGTATIEEVGRRRTMTRTASLVVALAVVQWPMAGAVRDAAGSAYACEVPGRLWLLVDVVLVVTAVYAAYRAGKYVRYVGDDGWTRIAWVGAALAGVAAVLHLAGDVVLWREFAPGPGGCADLSLGWFSWLVRAVWLVVVLVLLTCLLVTSRFGQRRFHHREPLPQAHFERERDPGPDAGRLVICCSGGGIRSASFSLGALQQLREEGLYDKASTVIGVSGGGYLAAAFHILRRTSPDPFAPGSPELARLRRQTWYLLQGTRAAFRAAMSVLFGLVVNLLLVGVALRALAWVLGWFLGDQGVIAQGGAGLVVDLTPNGSWAYVGLAVAPLVVSAAMFVLEKIWDRWARMSDPVRAVLSTVGGATMRWGIPLLVLLLGVPAALLALERWSDDSKELSPVAILQALVDPAKQGVASFSALVVVLVGLGRTVLNGLAMESGASAESRLRSRLLGFARNRLAPWLGSAIVIVAALLVLLRWTSGYATDPAFRSDWVVALVLAGIVVAVKLLTDANRTSLHAFYRERLSRAFLVKREPNGAAVSLDYSLRLRYSDWARPVTGGPQLVIAGVANVSDPDFVPSQRDCVPFVFDPDRIGIVGDRSLPAGGRRTTADYEREADMLKREVTVPAAMAISGAAISPLTGRTNSRSGPVRLLLALLNARLGVWLPNPYWHNHPDGSAAFPEVTGRFARFRRYVGSVVDKPGPYRLLREAVGKPSMYDRRIYVTDGGHYDNLGLVEALRREPAQVIVIDASNDAEDRFTALGEAIATARMDHGIHLDLDPAPLARGDQPRADRAWAYGVATHPPRPGETEPLRTEVFYLKAVLTGRLGWDIEQYAAAHPDFPRRSTGDQFYDEWDFEAYRSLGHALAATLTGHHRVRARLDALPDP